MNTNEINAAVRGITGEYGGQILQNPKRLRALLSDYIPDTPQDTVNEVLQKIERGETAGFLAAEELDSLRSERNSIAQERDTLKTQLSAAQVENTALSAVRTEFRAYKKAAVHEAKKSEHERDNLKSKLRAVQIERNVLGADLENCKNALMESARGSTDSVVRILQDDLRNAMQNAAKYKAWFALAVFIAGAGLICSLLGYCSSKSAAKRENYLSIEKEKLTTQVGSLTSERNTITAERDTLKTQLSAAQTELASYKKAAKKTAESARVASVISVREMSVGNWGKNFWGTKKWLTKPGGKLTAREIQYLNPVFSYNASVNKTLTFYVAIKNPSGRLITGGGSPANYTYSFQRNVRNGGNTLDAEGWGSDSGGSYYPGTWTIDLWHDGVRLYSGKVTLN